MAALGVVVYVGSHLWAQQAGTGTAAPAAQAPPLQSRIALINLSAVVKEYKKWTNFQDEMKSTVVKYEKDLQARKAQLDGWQSELAKNPDAARREQLEKSVRATQREMQEISDDAKQVLAKKEGDQLVIIYKEVHEAAARYAAARNIELVMHYNDAVTESDLNNPANVQRKMTTGACMPIVMDPRMDISKDVAWMLNDYYKRSTPTTQATPAGSTGTRQ